MLVYSAHITRRLQYSCHLMLREFMGLVFEITDNWQVFEAAEGPKINYSDVQAAGNWVQITPHGLLQQTGIHPVSVTTTSTNGYPIFFCTGGQWHWDIFSATFYLVTRYEEYLPHSKDAYGRFDHTQSLAFKEGFLNKPLVNWWLLAFAKHLMEVFPDLPVRFPTPAFTPTYDIDIAYAFRHKGWLRNVGQWLKQPSLLQPKVLAGITQDPFDVFSELDHLHQQHQLQPIYFFLVAAKNGQYDKHILPHKKAMHQLVKRTQQQYAIGLHPSWQSGDWEDGILVEKKQLQQMCGEHFSVTRSRQHYIRFNLPDGYRRLLKAGIQADYSMGYGSINGFRASYANPFYWYDLPTETVTLLRVYPFCYMEANSLYEQRQSPEESLSEMYQYAQACIQSSGHFISIWHNHMMGSHPLYKGWGKMYRDFLQMFCR